MPDVKCDQTLGVSNAIDNKAYISDKAPDGDEYVYIDANQLDGAVYEKLSSVNKEDRQNGQRKSPVVSQIADSGTYISLIDPELVHE